jgi:hypothetical protein
VGKFSFNGKTIVAPGILSRSSIGAQRVLQLLPFGVIAMVGASDGGAGSGSIYRFTDTTAAQRLLRGGPLLKALQRAAATGGSAGFVAVVAGTKTSGTLNLTTATVHKATLTAGDQGTWTNSITYQAVAGTTSGVAVILTYPDPISGQTVTLGGKGTAYDNILLWSALNTVLLNDPLVTPPSSSGLPPLVTLTIITDGLPDTMSSTPLATGTGSGAQTLTFNSDIKPAIDAMIEVEFDIAHLVGIYDSTSQAYADGQAQTVATYTRLRRWIHQIIPGGTSPSSSKTTNSLAVVNAATTAAQALNSIRSSMLAQQVQWRDPNTGLVSLVDSAPLLCGMAANAAATGAWGPASPLTFDQIPGALAVDYPVLKTTGDLDNMILAGAIPLQQIGAGANAAVRIVQSVTTAPNDANGNPWVFAEFSVVRVSDALLANVKATVETANPKILGGGNTTKTMGAIIADVRDILEDALENQWITGFDPASIQIATTGNTGTDDIVKYSAGPTVPLNHLGVDQTLIPFQATVSLGGQING